MVVNYSFKYCFIHYRVLRVRQILLLEMWKRVSFWVYISTLNSCMLFQFHPIVFLLHFSIFLSPLFFSKDIHTVSGRSCRPAFLCLSLFFFSLSLSLPRSVFVHVVLKLGLLCDCIQWAFGMRLTMKHTAVLKPHTAEQSILVLFFCMHCSLLRHHSEIQSSSRSIPVPAYELWEEKLIISFLHSYIYTVSDNWTYSDQHIHLKSKWLALLWFFFLSFFSFSFF